MSAIVTVVGFLGLMCLIHWLTRVKRFRFLWGVKLISYEAALVALRDVVSQGKKTIRFGLELPLSALEGGFLLMGAPGTGKTLIATLFRHSLIKLFSDSHRGASGEPEDVLVVDFDPKRQNYVWTKWLPLHVPFIDLSPFTDALGWDVSGECETDADIMTVADGLIPEVKNDAQPHFRGTAVLLVASVLRAAKWKGHRLTWRELVLITTDLLALRQYLRSCPVTKPVVVAHLNDGEEAMSVFSTLASAMNRYRTVAACWAKAARLVTTSEILQFGKAVVNMPYEDDAVVVLVPILRLLLLRFEQKILSANRSNQRIIFILDEYRILRDVRFNLLACKGREAGVSLLFACQGYVGCTEAHSEKIVSELFGLMKNRIFLRLDNHDDATYASKSLGQWHAIHNQGTPNGVTEGGIQVIKNADPEEVQNLPVPTKKDLVVRGYGITPVVKEGPFKIALPFEQFIPVLDEAKNAPRPPRRPKDHQNLEPFSPAERRALGLG